MKILMINHFPLAGSGSGTYTKNLAVHLAEQGHEVTVIFPENTADYDDLPWVNLRPVFFTPDDGVFGGAEGGMSPLPFNFPCFTTHPRSNTAFSDLSEEQLQQYMAAFTEAIGKEVAENRPDVIHGQHVWILPSLAGDYDIPLILTAHGTDLMGYDKWPQLRIYAEKAVAACDKVIAISKDNFNLVESHFPAYREKIVFMRNGYDPTVFFSYDDELTREEVLGPYGLAPEEYEARQIVIFAGKLTYAKGVDVLLESTKQYESVIAHDPLTLIVGDGEERANLEAQAEELGLAHVRFLGNVAQDELCRLYNVSDVAVVPSRQEAFGLVALEAMACALPVVASEVGGMPDFVNDTVGRLIPAEDAETLAAAIMSILNRAALDAADYADWCADIADYARNRYAQDTIIQDLVDLYDTCIKK